MSSKNHFKKESSPFSAAVELDCLPNEISLPVNSQFKSFINTLILNIAHKMSYTNYLKYHNIKCD